MQGTAAPSAEEEEARRRQCEEEEKKVQRLEDSIHRLGEDIKKLESEESQISAKEKIIRQKLRETETSFEDIQKSFSNQDGDAVNYIYSQIPDLQALYPRTAETTAGQDRTYRAPAVYSMEINVEKDRQTGETKILSTSAIGPEAVHQRGIKVYDDGNKVVYEVRSGGVVVENGVHKLSSHDVDELLHKAEQSNMRGGLETPALAERTVLIDGNLSRTKEQILCKEAKLEMVKKAGRECPGTLDYQRERVKKEEIRDGGADQPVTMIFMGYQNIDDEETKKVLGYDDAIKAELVLIDEDDEKSLREKTVTDISIIDGNAAELVSGKLLTDTTEPSSPEAKEESLTTEPVPEVKGKHVQFEDHRGSNSYESPGAELSTVKLPKISDDDDTKLKKNRAQNSASPLYPAGVTSVNKETMEFEIPISEHKAITLVASADPIDHQSSFFSPVASHNGLDHPHESIDNDVAKEIQYLDDVLEANCCDSSMENTFNGTSSPAQSTTVIEGTAPSINVVNDHAFIQKEIIVVDQKQPPAVERSPPIGSPEQHKPNGHSPFERGEEPCDAFRYPGSPSSSNSSRRSSKDGDVPLITIKKEAKFELRAFHEDKKPAKLFEDIDEKDKIRVRKVRPSEEVIELEKERRELIRSQAVKKNPGIATKWWNPPQEKTLEEQLDEEHLESHKKYKERKQKQQGPSVTPPKPKSVSFVPPEPVAVNKEDIVTEQIDFSAARKQFLSMENTSQKNNQVGQRRSVTPKLFTVKPFYKSLSPPQPKKPTTSVSVTGSTTKCEKPLQANEEVTAVKASKVSFAPEKEHVDSHSSVPEQSQEPAWSENSRDDLRSKTWPEESEFMSATAVFTVVKDDDQDMADHLLRSISISSPPDESDSGLDELSVKSQDTTIFETLSNDFSMDNISDSGASNGTASALQENSLGDFSQPQTPPTGTPTDFRLEGMSKSFSDHGFCSPSSTLLDSMLLDDQLKYHAGLLVQNAIEQALAEQAERVGLNRETDFTGQSATSEQEVSTEHVESSMPTSPGFENPESTVADQQHIPSPLQPVSSLVEQVSCPVQQNYDAINKPKTLSYQDFELEGETSVTHLPVSHSGPRVTVEENRQEGGYFSKYSEAAELRSTAEVQEPEVTVGPFKLRSKKQRTLSMIEEEIRAAQDREEELKRQRQRIQNPPSPVSKTAPALPTRTALYKTAPGKIEKIKSPSSPTAEGFPQDLDLMSEDSAGNQRPKNLMETLLEDYESHKTKRRERVDDSSVIEATRVSRRKSTLALRWEAGIYANREEDE
ncbi:hypothetical protein NDU88_006238 [Pleurodeles waltl]|uniref:A-kinase anchor protein 2 C-terminal domain-containing protein n=3 Tax=Pleurodeles waltl TaxID=8319 RepID=A0AAV7X0Q4_PLEWA|nr:hypothetical protein NDU88_006238 [Pleurodeles waltl]